MKFKKILFLFVISLFFFKGAIAAELTPQERVARQSILYATGSNYLENAYYTGGKILRWNKSEFPIKVYVENSVNAPNYYTYAFIRSVLIWQVALKDVLSIKFVNNESEANIVFKVVNNNKYIRQIKQDDSHTLGYTSPTIKKGKLVKMYIYIYDRGKDGKYYDPYRVLNISIHEFGHALGIGGHSNDSSSIMYPLMNPDKEKKSGFISRTDINTVTLLYKVVPDITNGDKTKEKGNIRAEILLGDEDEREAIAIKQALDEVKIKPTDCFSWLKLAVLYEDRKEYDKMFEYIKKAEPLAKTKEELYSTYVAYSYYYYAKKDKKNAKAYLTRALAIKNDGSLKTLERFINLLRWKKIFML